MSNTPRSDVHRPGAIVPADYEFVLDYALAHSDGGFPMPSFGVCCPTVVICKCGGGVGSTTCKCPATQTHGTGPCCVINLQRIGEKFAETGGLGKCSVCGVFYVYGEVWRHVPTNELIHIGHICAAKYNLLHDRREFELALDRLHRNVATMMIREKKAEDRKVYLAEHPGLEEALKAEHHIVKDIAEKFIQYCNLSPRQIELVFKLANEEKTRSEAPAEKFVPAPTGKVTFIGRVVGIKTYESQFGMVTKMTVKMETPDGNWLAWGTIPSGCYENNTGLYRGDIVEVKATLEQGKDAHFAIFKRPNGKVISRAQVSNAPAY